MRILVFELKSVDRMYELSEQVYEHTYMKYL